MSTNQYQALITRQQEEFNKFPIKFAFNDAQFKQGMNELGLNENDTDKVVSTGAGGFMRKSDVDAYAKLGEKFTKELNDEIENDKFGNKFVKDIPQILIMENVPQVRTGANKTNPCFAKIDNQAIL